MKPAKGTVPFFCGLLEMRADEATPKLPLANSAAEGDDESG
jgi:hypothetical protein